MGCNRFLTKEDDKLIEAAIRGENTGIDPEKLEKCLPEIEKRIEQRCIQCLQENVENGKNLLIENANKKGRPLTFLEELDLRIKPTLDEYKMVFEIGKELRMAPWEIINYPVILGVKDPKSLERIPFLEKIVREVISNLHESRIAPWFRDAEVVDMVMFMDINKEELHLEEKTLGGVLPKGALVDKIELPRVVHVFRDPETGKLPEGKRAHQVIIHEICHLNFYKEKTGEPSQFTKIFIDHFDEWITVCSLQLDKFGAVSPYAGKQLPKKGPREMAFFNQEFIAEHVSFWDAGLGVKICREMQKFFERYLSH